MVEEPVDLQENTHGDVISILKSEQKIQEDLSPTAPPKDKLYVDKEELENKTIGSLLKEMVSFDYNWTCSPMNADIGHAKRGLRSQGSPIRSSSIRK